jgi:hypothetical protein
MNEDEQIELGEYAENLMSQGYFNVLVQQFEHGCFQEMMSTEPKAVKEREGVFAQFHGLKSFLDLMRARSDAKDRILELRKALSEQDAPIDGID